MVEYTYHTHALDTIHSVFIVDKPKDCGGKEDNDVVVKETAGQGCFGNARTMRLRRMSSTSTCENAAVEQEEESTSVDGE